MQFQEPRTELWLFDALVIPTLLYGEKTWGPNPNKEINWKDLEKRLVSTIANMIRSNASVPHEIVWAEMGAAPILIEALLRSVACIQRLWKLHKRRYSMTIMSSKQPTEHGDIHCWYAKMQQWFESHGMSINALPLLQYSLESPSKQDQGGKE